MSSRIRTSHPAGHTPANVFTDFEWLHHNRERLFEEYGEKFVVIYQEKVIGMGSTRSEALADAETNLPPNIELATPIVDKIYRRNPFLRAKPVDASE